MERSSKAGGDIFMETSDREEVTTQAVLMAFRQLSDGLKQTNKLLEAQGNQLTTALADLSIIKGQDVITKLGTLSLQLEDTEKRIKNLETERDRRDGITNAIEYVSKIGPWLTFIAVACLAAFGKIKIGV